MVRQLLELELEHVRPAPPDLGRRLEGVFLGLVPQIERPEPDPVQAHVGAPPPALRGRRRHPGDQQELPLGDAPHERAISVQTARRLCCDAGIIPIVQDKS